MRIFIQGNNTLNGVYRPGNNPNSAKALLAASMLTNTPSTLHGIPRNQSTEQMLRTAKQLGMSIHWDGEYTATLETVTITRRIIDEQSVAGAVGTLLLLAPLLVRRQHVRIEVDFPLGRIRTHLDAMRDLGLDVVISHGALECRRTTWESRDIILNTPSVTATALAVMLAASLGQHTIIRNAASEPHITDLAHMLSQMGAQIDGMGSNVLTIHGTSQLHGTTFTVGYDHVEIASIAAIAALSGGRLQIQAENGHPLPDLRTITRTFSYFGMTIDADEQAVVIPRHERFAVAIREEDIDASVETAPYPGFPSDLVTIATVIATQAHGTSLIHEKLFRDRLLFVDTLKGMGANIILADPHRAVVVGRTPLQGTYIPAPDARFGLGMLGAALIAEGESVIDNAEAFDYTFDGILTKLRSIGANIVTETES